MTGASAIRERIRTKLVRLYGDEQGAATANNLFDLLGKPAEDAGRDRLPVSEQDIILITYGDQVQREGEAPLATLHRFLREMLAPAVNGVHLLPFYPYSSDDGFSVIDYRAVDSRLGDWRHIRALGDDFRLMFDAVFNHISAKSTWFEAFKRREAPYDDYFITVDPDADLSQVVRPRALPLLTPVQTASGEQHVWTTFSDDQIDLNYGNPHVLLAMIELLLFYVEQGASLIRLDAIAFLWKRLGTSCIHLEETHLVVQLLRDVLDLVAPEVILITETNVPHEENIAYFGNGKNEAQMVYQFPLPPLVLHTLHTGDVTRLTQWVGELEAPGEQVTFFNFTASHDGIGLRPVTGLLKQKHIDTLLALTEAHGGRVSYKSNPDGSESPYELNIAYFDAITHPDVTARDPETAIRRFLVSQAIMLALAGVPGIYFHSLVGSRNDKAGVARTGQPRSINREKLDEATLREALAGEGLRAGVYGRYMDLLRVRTREPAFHPLGEQTVLDLTPGVFTLERRSPDGKHRVIALHHVRGETLTVEVPAPEAEQWEDLFSGELYTADETLQVVLEPYQVMWLKAR